RRALFRGRAAADLHPALGAPPAVSVAPDRRAVGVSGAGRLAPRQVSGTRPRRPFAFVNYFGRKLVSLGPIEARSARTRGRKTLQEDVMRTILLRLALAVAPLMAVSAAAAADPTDQLCDKRETVL